MSLGVYPSIVGSWVFIETLMQARPTFHGLSCPIESDPTGPATSPLCYGLDNQFNDSINFSLIVSSFPFPLFRISDF